MVESNSDNRRNILLIDNSVDYFSKIVDGQNGLFTFILRLHNTENAEYVF